MAAFPPPTLRLQVPEPLRGLFRSCRVEWGYHPGRTRRRSLVPEAWLLQEAWFFRHELGGDREQVAFALRQFELLLGNIRNHRGSIVADEGDGCFDDSWQTPHDCLTYFADWRQAISEAIRGMNDPPFFNPAWMTETVVALRNAILAEKAFDRLPILADALEEAGCDNRFVLDHLRGDDDHTHMCWVLDLLSVG